MIVYWILLLPIAFLSYVLGSMRTTVLASRFIFRYNLNRLGKGNIWLSNFRRRYGVRGALGLLLAGAIRDAIPLVVASLLMGIKGHGDVGRAFAMFCLVLGQLYPFTYSFRGKSAFAVMVIAAGSVNISIGIITLAVGLAAMYLTRTAAAGAIAGAFIMLSAAILIVDDAIITRLYIYTGILVIIKHIPALIRILNRTEPKFSFSDDLSYKFDT